MIDEDRIERAFIELDRFRVIVIHCSEHQEFVAQFDRIMKTNLLGRGTPIDLMVDSTSGRFECDAKKFIEFVYETVWTRCHALHDERSWESHK